MLRDDRYHMKLRLEEGDIISFNNRRIFHARSEFDSKGARLLEGTYIDLDEFASRYRSLQHLYEPHHTLHAMGNKSHGEPVGAWRHV